MAILRANDYEIGVEPQLADTLSQLVPDQWGTGHALELFVNGADDEMLDKLAHFARPPRRAPPQRSCASTRTWMFPSPRFVRPPPSQRVLRANDIGLPSLAPKSTYAGATRRATSSRVGQSTDSCTQRANNQRRRRSYSTPSMSAMRRARSWGLARNRSSQFRRC